MPDLNALLQAALEHAHSPNAWAQIAIALFGVSAIWLSQSVHASNRRWASVCGLVGQPAWFYSSINGGQWGIFLLSIAFTVAWGKGFYNHWVRPQHL